MRSERWSTCLWWFVRSMPIRTFSSNLTPKYDHRFLNNRHFSKDDCVWRQMPTKWVRSVSAFYWKLIEVKWRMKRVAQNPCHLRFDDASYADHPPAWRSIAHQLMFVISIGRSSNFKSNISSSLFNQRRAICREKNRKSMDSWEAKLIAASKKNDQNTFLLVRSVICMKRSLDAPKADAEHQ